MCVSTPQKVTHGNVINGFTIDRLAGTQPNPQPTNTATFLFWYPILCNVTDRISRKTSLRLTSHAKPSPLSNRRRQSLLCLHCVGACVQMKSFALAVERSSRAGRQKKNPIRSTTTTTRPSPHRRSPGKLLPERRGDGESGSSRRLHASVSSSEAQTTAMPAFEDFSELVKSGKYKLRRVCVCLMMVVSITNN